MSRFTYTVGAAKIKKRPNKSLVRKRQSEIASALGDAARQLLQSAGYDGMTIEQSRLPRRDK